MWLINAVYQAAVLFTSVIYATRATFADRASGMPWTHWEVRNLCLLPEAHAVSRALQITIHQDRLL